MTWLIMLVFNGYILIDGFKIDGIADFTSTFSRANLVQTCGLNLPGLEKHLNRDFKVGSRIQVYAGYDGNYNQEFSGYISEIQPKHPLALRCEDEMWLLKRGARITEAWNNVFLSEIITRVIDPKADVSNCPKILLEPFRIDNVTRAGALAQLKKDFGVDVYYRKGRLVVTFPLVEKVGSDVFYQFGQNIIDSDFTFKREDDRPLSVRAISYLKDGKKLEINNVGDPEGEQRTLSFYGVTDEKELKKIAEREMAKLKFTGLEGSFTTFGDPVVQFGQVARIYDPRYDKRAGRYLVESITTNISKSGGFKRTINLGIRLDVA